MSEPVDFDPGDFDPSDFEPGAASLRRQFSPPPLDGLHARISEAAAHAEREARPRPTARIWGVGVAVAFAAAATVLLALRSWESATLLADPVHAPTSTELAVAPTAAQVAGRQLDDFLSRDRALPQDGDDCAVPVPPQACDGSGEGPRLAPSDVVQPLGECGGTTGVDCARFDLPADHALVVRLMPSGATAIVCIERAWTDPHPELPKTSAYNLFRSELGAFVIYEITPLAEPQAIDSLRL